ncbi:HepT-like ribonuclease domain-containing protein [Pyrobaculum calidifontis]|uniref:HepT-like ribonuclease domain-containing protein n=1 Tax=Pyrobaculum calidifontis TaxID=181486 RepID=UPI0003257A34|nr:HepT-like ribonuclease domain-containing protein [Pyrobaculum calidifontis]
MRKDYKRYRAIVGFRNILVHGYASIDISIIEDILKNKRYRETVELAKKILERVRDP